MNRVMARFDRRRGFGKLHPASAKDVRGYRHYLALYDRLRVFWAREVLALRRHDLDEYYRLDRLAEHTRNQRTNVTADMGLKVCGT